jgi:flagellin
MALAVNTNVPALNAQNKLHNTSNALSGVFERISSGLRINRAANDAAGLGVSESLDAEIRAFKQGIRNVNDGISIIQTLEGATNEVANVIKRMRELAVQSSSETLATDERAYVDDEFEQLSAEVERIAQSTTFNGAYLATNGTAAGSWTGSDKSIQIQVGGTNNNNDRINVTLVDLRATGDVGGGDGTGYGLGISYGTPGDFTASLSTTTNAQSALGRLDGALGSLNAARSVLGAQQNRLESALRNLTNYTENLSAAKSRILDADFAHETAQLAKFQILQQSGVAVLGQANAISQAALRLLG